MKRNTVVRRAIQLALANAAAASIAVPALASQAVPAPSTNTTSGTADSASQAQGLSELKEVVVTGSRIYIPGLHSISPVTSINANAIASTGLTTIEDVLNQLPQVTADQGAMLSNGATGTATINLRDLGANRTLVLVNGERLMPGTAGGSAADVNMIPAALVQRVDVLTGGASAVYGADAVAGVVNFVMKDNFQGFEIDANASINQHSQHQGYYGQFAPASGYGSAPSSNWDGGEKDISFIMGSNFAGGKGNATAYLSYRRSLPVLQAARDFSRCTLSTNGKGVVSCSGSSTTPTGGYFFSNPPGMNGYDFAAYTGKLTVDPATGQFVPFTQLYNYGASNYYIRPDTRWNGGFFAHYNIDDNHQVYSSFMAMTDHTFAQIAPSGAFLASGLGVNPVTGIPDGGWSINCDNPMLSPQEQQTICQGATSGQASIFYGRRNVEGGFRADDLTHSSFRLVIGSRGNITDNLTYNAYIQEGLTLSQENYQNDVSKTKLTYAMNAVLQNGQLICAANANGANGAPGCVPYDVWGLGSTQISPQALISQGIITASGAPSQAAVNYITTPGLHSARTEERVFHADFTWDGTSAGFKLPGTTEGLVTNFGTEYREEFTSFRPDQEFATGDLAGQGGKLLPLSGGYGVKEAFIEARLPLVQDKPFMKEISINPGYRYSKYDLGFSTSTYKFMADWAPNSDIRLRGGYNRAVRAPSISELYASQTVALDGSEDPCATTGFGSPPSYLSGSALAQRQSQCLAHGVTAAQFGSVGMPGNPAGQYNGFIGGNPSLKPETADTYTLGLVFTPTFLPSLSATLDYYDIKINHVIGSYGANLIVNQCVINNSPFFCNLVHRDTSGSIWLSQQGYVIDTLHNLGYLWERGVDVSVQYRKGLGRWGALDMSLYGTYVGSFITEPYPAQPGLAASGSYNCAGYYGATCGNPLPKWRNTLTATWETPVQSLDVTARWRHFGNTEIDTANPSPLLSGNYQKSYQYTGTRDYLDLSANYMVFRGVEVLVGCNNVLDKDPPVLATTSIGAGAFNGNTFPQVYDTLGRYLFVNVKADF